MIIQRCEHGVYISTIDANTDIQEVIVIKGNKTNCCSGCVEYRYSDDLSEKMFKYTYTEREDGTQEQRLT